MQRPFLDPLLAKLVELKGSDLYLTVGCAPSIRVESRIVAMDTAPLTDSDIDTLLEEMLDEQQREEFYSTMELNTAFPWSHEARFRINVFRQQQHSGVVVRRIQTEIPTIESLFLPKIYSDLIMETRGLVLVVGPTGSGKTTSLAAMIGHRNQHGSGHIVTIEDPIEFIHQHQKCIVSQRDIGIDTYSFGLALKNALRQRPDVVLIGEIRDRETMEHALHFSETGHLCVATLHANNASQTIERILNYFPEEKHAQICHNLANNLRGILSQRLVLNKENHRVLAVEVLLNRGLIRNLIQENKLKDIHDTMERNRNEGMQTFDQALFDLYIRDVVSEDMAITESDNPANLRLQIRQHQNSKKSSFKDTSSMLDNKPRSTTGF